MQKILWNQQAMVGIGPFLRDLGFGGNKPAVIYDGAKELKAQHIWADLF